MAGGILLGSGGFFDQLRSGTAADRAAVLRELFVLTQPDYGLEEEVLSGCLGLLESGKLSASELAPHLSRITAIWLSTFVKVRHRQEKALSIKWTAATGYHEDRKLLQTVLKFFGYLSPETVLDALRDCMSLTDLRLKLAAVLSLLRLNQSVDVQALESIGASNETRIGLWRGLKELRLEAEMPRRWATAPELAASSLADWTGSPFEMGSIPEEMELMNVFPTNGGERVLDVYLFRFRQRRGTARRSTTWLAGVAGPFYNGEELNSPWSAFDPWSSLSPEQHFTKLFYR
jgi:hypothetical protein